MGVDQPHPRSLDDNILSYIRCMQCSSSKSPTEKQYQSISKKQILNFFTDDYDTTTTKKDVKYALKRLAKRGVISKDGMGYSYIQPHQISIDNSTSSDEGYHNQKVNVQLLDDVATGGSIEHSATTSIGDIEPSSLDDVILSFIRSSCQSSSTSGVQTSISREQIQKHYDIIVNEYDTTKKNVKHSLKRLLKRNVIVKVGKKKYSYIQPHHKNIDICTIIKDRPSKRKRQPEESSGDNVDVSASTTESTTIKKKYKYICTYEGCNNQIRNQGLCIKHGAKKKRCSVDDCTNQAYSKGVCVKHGAKVKICKHEGCSNKVVNSGVCIKHGAKIPPRKKCEREGCNSYAQRLGVCWKHGGSS